MKKLLSALTALAMCFSMTAASLPASALSLTNVDDTKATAGDWVWKIEDATFDPDKDTYATMNITVKGDQGTYGFIYTMLVDGKSLEDAGFEVVEAGVDEGPYASMTVVSNDATGEYAGTEGTKTANLQANDGDVVYYYTVVPPSTAKPGDVFKFEFTKFSLANYEKSDAVNAATAEGGTLTIVGGDSTESTASTTQSTTTASTTQSTSATTKTTTATTNPSGVDKSNLTSWSWYVEDTTFDITKDTYATIPIKVTKDQGTFGFKANILVDGKGFETAGFSVEESGVDDGPYASLTLVQNHETGEYAAAEAGKAENSTAADNEQVLYFVVIPPSDAKVGDVYNISIEDLLVTSLDADKNTLSFTPPAVAAIGGTLTIVGGETTESTTATTESTTATTENPEFDSDALFEVIDWEMEPDDAYGRIGIRVSNDPGTFGFQFVIKADGQPFDAAGLEVLESGLDEGPYASMTLVQNHATGEVKAAEGSKAENSISNGEEIIYFLVDPADRTPGKEYQITITDVKGATLAGEFYTPHTQNGVLKIKDNTTTTTEETTTTTEATTTTTEATTTTTESTTESTTQSTVATTKPFEETVKVVDAVWDIGEVECAAGATVNVPVTVTGNTGFNSYIAKLTSDAGPVAQAASEGANFSTLKVASNLDNLTIGATDYTSKANVTGDGEVFIVSFKVPADAAPGTKYNLNFADLSVYDIDMNKLVPQTTGGYILVKTDETTLESGSIISDAQWIIGTTEVEAGASVDLPVSIKGDKDGINSYKVALEAAAGLTATGASQGSSYAELGFAANTNNLTFGGTASNNGNVVAPDGDVFYVTFVAPTEPGRYPVIFAATGNEFRNIDMNNVVPTLVNGWIEVKAQTTTTEETTTTTEETTTTTEVTTTTTEVTTTTTEETTTTTEETTTTTESGNVDVTPVIQDNVFWVIGNDEVEAGATVTIPVTVVGDTDGFNSYIMKMDWQSKPGLTLDAASNGNVFADNQFAFNLGNATFAAVNYTSGNLVVPEDGVVFNVTFTVPADAEPGTVYPLKFAGLEVYGIDMARLVPRTTDGWIKVKSPETTTTEETTTTTEETTTTTEETTTTTEETTTTTEETTTTTEETTTTTEETTTTTEETTTTTEETTTTTTEATTTTEETTTTTETTTTQVVSVVWDIDDVTVDLDAVNAGQKTVQVNVFIKEGDSAANSYLADLTLDSHLTQYTVQAGNAFGSTMGFANNTTDALNPRFAGTNSTSPIDVPGRLGTDNPVFSFIFTIPEDAQVGDVYPITFANVEIQRLDGALVQWTGEPGSITITGEPLPEVVEYEYSYSYEVEGADMFYFAHDPRAFSKSDLTGSLKRKGYNKDHEVVSEEDVALSAVSIKLTREGSDLDNPKAVYEAEKLAYCKVPLQAAITDFLPIYNPETGKVEFQDVTVTITSADGFVANAWIGVKGDTNLNGECRANDASLVLVYTSLNGLSAGSSKLYQQDETRTAEWSQALENFVYFLSDINGESMNGGETNAWGTEVSDCNAADASYQLIYAATAGLHESGEADWAGEILNEMNPLPMITYNIVNNINN